MADRSDLQVPARDGYPLAATLYGGADDGDRVVLVAPATGVARRLYGAFASYLARAGFRVLTWDWRGTGGSRPERLRGFRASMRDWAERDLGGAIDWAAGRFPGARLFCVGHSFGGQAVGLAPNAHRIERLVTVGAQSGYWGHWPRPGRYGYAALWYAGVPLLARAFGYLPGRVLGGEALPREVALQWARWCRSPEYLGDYRGHVGFRAPILALSFTDDAYAPAAAVDALHARYGSRALTRRPISPAEVGVERIGHFGFFRSQGMSGLWREVGDWLGG